MTQPEGMMCFESERSSAFCSLLMFLWNTRCQIQLHLETFCFIWLFLMNAIPFIYLRKVDLFYFN